MAKVHPNAVIGGRVELADDVEVGPFCVIEGDVRIGSGTRLLSNVAIQGPTTIGQGNTLYPGATVGYAPQDLKFDPAQPGAGLVIGDRNVIREGVTFHRASKDQPTRIGSDNYFMAMSHIGHDCQIGSRIMMANSACVGGHVEIQDGAILSANTGVHQFVRIGRMAMISGGQAMAQDLPPFCLCMEHRYIGGLNLIGMRRAGLREHITPLRQAFKFFFRSGHAAPNALAKIEKAGLLDDSVVAEFVEFLRTSQRGIGSYRKPREQSTI